MNASQTNRPPCSSRILQNTLKVGFPTKTFQGTRCDFHENYTLFAFYHDCYTSISRVLSFTIDLGSSHNSFNSFLSEGVAIIDLIH